jgi:hypothetical protein
MENNILSEWDLKISSSSYTHIYKADFKPKLEEIFKRSLQCQVWWYMLIIPSMWKVDMGGF